MLKAFLIPILLLPCLGLFCQENSTYPKINDVVIRFYKRYEIDQDKYPHVNFEKRKKGWYVVRQIEQDNQLKDGTRNLFFDAVTKTFLSLPFEKNSDNREIVVSEYVDDYSLGNYDVQPFYGYRGWPKDVISELEKKKDLTNYELNALARAYSTYAGDLLSGQYGEIAEDEIWKLSLQLNCLTPVQIARFNFLEVRAQKYFQLLAKKDPGYETIVGKIGMKAANEVMFQYTALLSYANDFAKHFTVPKDLYTEEQLTQARKYLNDCPNGAIFLSLGDNDFYPVHYLQYVYKLRTDVHVINYSMIGMGRYIYQMTFPQYEAPPVKISADTNMYKDRQNEMVYVRNSSYTMDVDELLNILRTVTKDDQGRATIKADKIGVRGLNSEKTGNSMVVTINNIIELENVEYLFKEHWILLDLISNLGDRKLCMTSDFDDQLKGLNRHLTNHNGLLVYSN